MLLLPEGYKGEAWELPKKLDAFENRREMDRKLIGIGGGR
jgi:hypothetical protein